MIRMVPEEGLEPSRPRGHGTLRRPGGGHEVYAGVVNSMQQRGKSGNRLPRLCIYSYLVGRVYFTIYFTVRGGSRPPPGGRYAEKLKIPSLSPEILSVVGCLR